MSSVTRIGKKLMVVIVFIVLFLPTIVCAEGWKNETIEFARTYNELPVLFPDPVIATLWGGTKNIKNQRKWKKDLKGKLEKIKIATSLMKVGSLEVMISLQKKGNIVQKAPLVLFIPGIFNALDDPYNMNVIHSLYGFGFHVLTVPNSWTKEFLKQNPTFLPSDIESEARLNLQVLKNVKDIIGRKNISKTHVVGHSYGAFLAPVVTAINARSKYEVIDGSTYLIGPSFNIIDTMNRIDNLINNNDGVWNAYCKRKFYGPKVVAIFLNLIKANSISDLSNDTEICTPSLLAQLGFKMNLKKMIKAVHENFGFIGLPEVMLRNSKKGIDEKAYKRWLKRFTYTDFYKLGFKTDLVKNFSNEKMDLTYWLKKSADYGYQSIKILTTEDDILNPKGSLKIHAAFIDRKNLIVLPWGGHNAYNSFNWFQKLMKVELLDR